MVSRIRHSRLKSSLGRLCSISRLLVTVFLAIQPCYFCSVRSGFSWRLTLRASWLPQSARKRVLCALHFSLLCCFLILTVGFRVESDALSLARRCVTGHFRVVGLL